MKTETETYYSLRDVAEMLATEPYRIVYQITVRRVTEPARLGGRRAFSMEDIKRLATALGVNVKDRRRS